MEKRREGFWFRLSCVLWQRFGRGHQTSDAMGPGREAEGEQRRKGEGEQRKGVVSRAGGGEGGQSFFKDQFSPGRRCVCGWIPFSPGHGASTGPGGQGRDQGGLPPPRWRSRSAPPAWAGGGMCEDGSSRIPSKPGNGPRMLPPSPLTAPELYFSSNRLPNGSTVSSCGCGPCRFISVLHYLLTPVSKVLNLIGKLFANFSLIYFPTRI